MLDFSQLNLYILRALSRFIKAKGKEQPEIEGSKMLFPFLRNSTGMGKKGLKSVPELDMKLNTELDLE